eukprot:6937588-Prorocentrum_lima.AAC.1
MEEWASSPEDAYRKSLVESQDVRSAADKMFIALLEYRGHLLAPHIGKYVREATLSLPSTLATDSLEPSEAMLHTD